MLAAATGLGFTWRARNGQFRVSSRKAAAAPVPAAAPARRPGPGDDASGLLVPAATAATATGAGAAGALSADDLGGPLGSRATLVQFSTAFCAPCRATRRILAEVAGMTDGVRHVEVDAESRLDLVRKLDVYRTPTTFVLGPDGHVSHRASGQPRKADVIAALGAVL